MNVKNVKSTNNTIKTSKRQVRQLTDAEIGFMTAILTDSPFMSDADVAHRIHDAGYAKDLCMKDLRNKVRYGRRKVLNENPSERTRIISHKDGSVSINHWETGMSDDFAEKFLDEKLLEDIKLNPNEFQLSSYGESTWQNGKGEELHSVRKKFSRITGKNIDAENAYLAAQRNILLNCYDKDVDAMNKDISAIGASNALSAIYASHHNKVKIADNVGNYSLIVPLPDLHIGEGNADKMVLSYKATFENFIFPEIKRKYFSTPENVVDTIDFVGLGDIVHCDNNAGTTTAGTVLNPASNVYESYKQASNFLDWLIGKTLSLFATPVRFIYTYGNHDTNVGFYLMHLLQSKYNDVDAVSFIVNEKIYNIPNEDEWFFDSEENPEYLWVKYKNVGVTFTHGKFKKQNLKNIPEVAYRNARKEVDFNVVLYGHLHHLNEASYCTDQHNFGLSTPNFVRDKFGKSLGCVTDPCFYLFEINHKTNRIGYVQFPSLPFNRQ